MRIAVLGLGRMGAPVARNLVQLGHEVILYDRVGEKALQLASETGARVGGTVAEAAARASVALSLVPDDEAECAITLGPDGLVAHLADGAVHLCMSSIGMDTSRRLAVAHEAAGQGFVAAPILGKSALVSARQGWILAAGPELHLNRCMPLLESLAKGVTRVGTRPELAHVLRLGATAMTAAVVESLAEALAVGERAGIPPAEYFRVLNGVLFKSPLLDGLGGLIVRRDFAPTDLTLDLAAKDLRLWLDAAVETGVSVPGARTLARAFDEACRQGYGGQDLTALAAVRPPELPEAAEPVPPATLPAPAPWPEPLPPPPAPEPPPPPPAPEPPPPPPPAPELPPPPPPSERRNGSHRKRQNGERRKPAPPAPPAPPVPAPPIPTPPAPPVPVPPPVPEPPLPAAPEPARTWEPSAGPTYPIRGPEGTRQAPVGRTSHFQVHGGVVWAWVDGAREATFWTTLGEVEQAFAHLLFVRLEDGVLLNPLGVKEIKPLFPGRSRITVAGGIVFTAGREATRNLKFILGV